MQSVHSWSARSASAQTTSALPMASCLRSVSQVTPLISTRVISHKLLDREEMVFGHQPQTNQNADETCQHRYWHRCKQEFLKISGADRSTADIDDPPPLMLVSHVFRSPGQILNPDVGIRIKLPSGGENQIHWDQVIIHLNQYEPRDDDEQTSHEKDAETESENRKQLSQDAPELQTPIGAATALDNQIANIHRNRDDRHCERQQDTNRD
jgi:hypothetical protein